MSTVATMNMELRIATERKNGRLHMIGNAHIDPVWLWQWQEGFHEVKATFRSALDRMNEDADFIFSSSSAVFYQWIEESDPAMFSEIQQRVAEGRWSIVGGWWIQPDCNLPCGESFVRQGLYGQRYFKEKFGVIAHVGYNVDSFGHHAMLPQILLKSGLENYIFMRPSPHEKGLPARLFWWEADDGSRVLAYRIPYEYCSWGQDLEKHIQRCATELRKPFNELMCFYGVGNHGGGPTRLNLESIHRLNENPDVPELVFSSPDQYFAEALASAARLPVVHDELQHHASGCYSAHSGVKRWNRQAENLLLAAEKMSVVANCLTGQPISTEFARAWKNVLFNQFHDILAGTSIEAAYEDARNLYGEAMAIAGRALNLATQSIGWNIAIAPQEGMRPVVLFNPHAWPLKTNVELEVGGLAGNEALLDVNGAPVPMQTVQSLATANGRSRVSFLAEVPPMGYTTYRITPTQSQGEPEKVQATDTSLENDRFRLEINPETGWISSLRDKTHQLEVFCGEAARAVVIADPSDTWSHNVFRFDQGIGEFTPVSIHLTEQGPVKATLRVESEYHLSRLVQEFNLYRDIDTIDVQVTVDWREQFKMLKLRFPVNLSFMRPTYEIPYGTIERFANGEEEPGQSWVDLSGMSRDTGEPYGLSLLNDGKYSFDMNVREIGLTVLRSPIYVHHMPAVPQPDRGYTFMDQGVQRFTYTLLPHTGSWEQAGTVRRAAELNQRPIALFGTYHPQGKLPQAESFLSIEPENIVATVLKKAEDSDDLILRCYETSQSPTRATIRLGVPERVFETDFGPAEIKTFRIPRDIDQPVIETNLLEWTD